MKDTPRQQPNRKAGASSQVGPDPAKKQSTLSPQAPTRRGGIRDDEDTVEISSDEEE